MDEKIGFNIRLERQVIEDLERIGTAHGMDKNSYARLILSKFSQLKREHALDAITTIPKEFFRQRGGRPLSLKKDELAEAPPSA